MPLVRQQQRRDTAANWTAYNPVLLDGEFGVDTTADRVKVGDGVTAWSALPYSDKAEQVAADAARAEAAAEDAVAVSTGDLDPANAVLLNDPESATARAATASAERRFDRIGDAYLAPNRPARRLPSGLRKWRRSSVGVVAPTVPGTWKSTQSGVGMDVVWDHQRMQFAVVYGADNHNLGDINDPTAVSQIGVVFSDDIDQWYGRAAETPDPILVPNPTPGQPDSGGLTFPQLVWEPVTALWWAFCIAFPIQGFERGDTNSVCAFTCPTISTNPADWTRRGEVINAHDVPWIDAAGDPVYIYRPCVVRTPDGWGMFFNGGVYGAEQIGYATAPALTGPWTALPSVVLSSLDAPTPTPILQDPDVFRLSDTWYMVCSDGTGDQVVATTTDADFPTGWSYLPETLETGNVIRTVMVDSPKGMRMFTFDLLDNGRYGPVILRPSDTPRPPNNIDPILWFSIPQGGEVGNWSNQILDPSKPADGYVYNSPATQGDSRSFYRDLQCGSYWVILFHLAGPDRGIYSIFLDDDPTPIGTIDGYNSTPSVATRSPFLLSPPPFEGTHKITIKMSTKNAASSGYGGTICALYMERATG